MNSTIAKHSISVVVPLFNESGTIKELVERLEGTLICIGLPYEIILVDDYSTDGTWEFIKSLAKDPHIKVYTKQGKKGKAYSLVEGFKKANGNIFVMIDADLQYQPESIAEMVSQLNDADIVVANRKNYEDASLRKIFSKTFRLVFGKLLFNLDHDIQSGLKIFTRRIYKSVAFIPSSPWTFDLEFLYRAKEAGAVIHNHDITFLRRINGESKVSFISTTVEIGLNALLVRFKNIDPLAIAPLNSNSMRGAGIGFGRIKYITHTTLAHKKSAIVTLTGMQRAIVAIAVLAAITGFSLNPLLAAQAIVAILSVVYFVDVVFNFGLVMRSLTTKSEITVSDKDLIALDDRSLPVYTILCPLYREGHVLPAFLQAIDKIDWPKDKLDVLLLLEKDDHDTIRTVNSMILPSYVRSLIVPASLPKTKPKACNFGLSHARGEYLVIYDAEDRPDPLQLKKAYLGFEKVSSDVVCLQAKLDYFNPNQNLLTRHFAAEYSLWFDITLTGLQSINTTIPLGGTSNHFMTATLRQLEGWDPFNVTEDADLGVRLFKLGYKTAIIDSTTLEEANSDLHNWLRQRSRWIKGYMQTYLVHMRDIVPFVKQKGLHALIFQLIFGGKIAFTFINPILWIATISYFALYSQVGAAIELLYPAWVFYMACLSLVFGNFLFVYYYMISVAKKEQWDLMKYVLLVPIYWLFISLGGFVALYQLVFKPHFWEKTNHGLYVEKKPVQITFRLPSFRPAFEQVRYFINLFL